MAQLAREFSSTYLKGIDAPPSGVHLRMALVGRPAQVLESALHVRVLTNDVTASSVRRSVVDVNWPFHYG